MTIFRDKFRGIITIAICISVIFLAACSQTSKQTITTNLGELVTVDLNFDNLTSGLSTQAIPFENGTAVITRFEVQVFDQNDILVKFDSENTIDPTGSVDTLTIPLNGSLSVALSTGTYTFKSKAFAPNKAGGPEVLLAVGSESETVNVDTSALSLEVKTITESYTFESNTPLNYIIPGQTVDLMLVVKAPGGYLVPLVDYDVSYTIDMDNVSDHKDSSRGVRLIMKDPLVDNQLFVQANVTGTNPSGTSSSLPTIDGVENIPFLTSAIGPAFDTEAPSFTFAQPSLQVGQTGTLTGTADDNIGVAKVQVFDGPVLIGSSDSAEAADSTVALITFNGTTSWSMNFTPTTENYDFYAVALDTSGNQSSAEHTITANVSGSSSALITLSSGYSHSCSIESNNQVYCWGTGTSGQLGNGSSVNSTTAVAVTNPTGVSSWKSLSLGNSHSCGIANNDQAYCWGFGTNGELGNGSTIHKNTPTAVTNPSGVSSWKALSTGAQHTCGIADNDQAYCWGRGAEGRLGNGSTAQQNLPVAVTNPTGVSSWKIINSGIYHNCAVADTDQAYCWGYGADGQLGNGSNTQQNLPTAITIPTGVSSWESFSLGIIHSCGIADTGQAYCWGNGFQSQLGNGTTGTYTTPSLVTNPANVSSWKSLAISESHSCGIADNNQAYCWGRGANGRLGNGTTTDSSLPLLVTNPTGTTTWEILSAGVHHSCGTADDSKTYCWGYGAQSQLGTGSTSDSITPAQVVYP